MSQSSIKDLSQSIVFAIVVVGLIVLFQTSILAILYGGNQVPNAMTANDSASIAKRLKPVITLADIRNSGGVEAAAAPAVAAVTKSPKDLYSAVCMACHANAVGGAPKPGNKAAWEPRFAKGVDGLLASAKHGIGIMPPKGGSSYSDDELKSIIEYMLTESGLM